MAGSSKAGKGKPRIARWGTPEAEGLDPRRIIGKPHADRARQFVPFMALKGYFDLIEEADRMEGAETLVYEAEDFADWDFGWDWDRPADAADGPGAPG